MNESTKTKVDNLKKQYPGWEKSLKAYFDNDSRDIDNNLIKAFLNVVSILCEDIKTKQCSLEEASELFGAERRKEVKSLLHDRLRPFFACEFMRRNETEKRVQLEDLLDEIWQQRIIRRNLIYQFDQKTTEGLALSKDELEEFAATLSAIVYHCISRLLNYEAMVYIIEKQAGLSKEFSQYIARKIERDYEELRCNYIIKTLTVIRQEI